MIACLRKTVTAGIRQVTIPQNSSLQLEVEPSPSIEAVAESLDEECFDMEDEVTEIVPLPTMTIVVQPEDDSSLGETIELQESEEVPEPELSAVETENFADEGLEINDPTLEPTEIVDANLLETEPTQPVWIQPRERPEVLQATSRVIQTGCGPMHVTLAKDERGPYEVFARVGKAGGCASSQTEAISRLVSLCLSAGIDPQLVYQQISEIRCPLPAVDRGETIHSCADGISKVFEREMDMEKAKEPNTNS
jgi:ribonucleoside-diphosphate reductase alpha chain